LRPSAYGPVRRLLPGTTDSALCPQKSCRHLGTKPPLSYSRHKARDRTVGPGEVRRRPDSGPNSQMPLAPRCQNTWRRSCSNWMGIVPKTQGRGVNMGEAQQNRRAVLIVEDDAELREFAARLLEDGELDTIECESAEAALATMLIRGREVAMIFADIGLPGVMDGIDLAREVRMRWPFLPVILTSGHPPEGQLPLGVDFMPKPWQLLNLLVAAKQALSVSVRPASKRS